MMPFIEIKGLPGKVYIPDQLPDERKKNKCRDCFSCQMCSDDRCRICLTKTHIKTANHCSCRKSDDE